MREVLEKTAQTQYGYWEETGNDGRHICHTEKPEWWGLAEAPSAHHGWAARAESRIDGDYGWVFGESEVDALKNLVGTLTE